MKSLLALITREPAIIIGLGASLLLAAVVASQNAHSLGEWITAFVPLAVGILTRQFVSPVSKP